MQRLQRSFFERDTISVAKDLIGTYIVRQVEDTIRIGKIVETEAYTGIDDKAFHAYGNKRTSRTEVMYGKAGHAYVYLIYGMYDLLNIVTKTENEPEAVLIRAVEPIKGVEEMANARFQSPFHVLPPTKQKQLTNGPGKLCQALSITRDWNGFDLCNPEQHSFYLLPKTEPVTFTTAKRINIDYAEEAKHYLYRFYETNNPYVSVT